MDGIVWTTKPHADDATAKLVPGDLIAFNAQDPHLSVIWSDPILELFAKFNPPTIADGKVFRAVFAPYNNPPPDFKSIYPAPTPAGPGKVVVYGLSKTRRLHPHKLRLSIDEKWEQLGRGGAVAKEVGTEKRVGPGQRGRQRDYEGSVLTRHRRASVRAPALDVTCHRRVQGSIPIAASIFWSEETGAHLVQGEIREEYLRQGGPDGALGYPVSDEGNTPDGRGRVSYFEHGAIYWSFADGPRTELRPVPRAMVFDERAG